MRARICFQLRCVRVLALGAALFWPGDAPAQGGVAATSTTSAEAEARYQRGVEAFEQERWREAVELFKQADQLAPSALLSLNIAKVYERMRDSRSALAWYRDYLRRSPQTSEQAPMQKRVAELEASLRAQGVQQLSVFSTPPGATVLVDSSSRGVTPWTGELAPGQHQLELTRRGYADAEQSFELPADHAIDLTVNLLPSPAAGGAAPAAPPAAAEGAAVASTSGSEGTAAPALLDQPAIPEMEAPSAVPRWWTWGLFGASGAFLLGSGAVEVARRGLEGDAGRVQIDYKQVYDDVQSRRDTARLLLGLGAGFGILGGVSLYFDLRHADAAAGGVAIACEPGACAMRARQTW